MTRRALLIAVHAYPDPAVGGRRVSELANHLVDRGWEVKVAASVEHFPNVGGALNPRIERIGVPVPRTLYERLRHWVPDSWRGKNQPAALAATASSRASATPDPRPRLVERLRFEYVRYSGLVDTRKLWSVRLFFALRRVLRRWRPDVMLVSCPEWSPAVATAAVAQLGRLPLVFDLRDPWLDRGGYTDPFYPGPRRWADQALQGWVVHRARALTVSSGRLAERMRRRYPAKADQVHLVRNGYDEPTYLDPPQTSGRLDLLYAGTVYFNRNPMPLLEGLARWRHQPGVDASRVSLTLVGHCGQWQDLDLRTWVRDHQLQRVVRVLPPVSVSEVHRLTAASQILVNLAQRQPDQVPAKLFEQLGANREIWLFTEADSESADVVAGVPWVTRLDDDPDQVQAALTQAYARHVCGEGRALTDPALAQHYSRRSALQAFEQLLTEISDGPTRP